jgi:hypothetical protein
MRAVICALCWSCWVAVGSAAGPFDGRWNVQLTAPASAVVQNLTIILKTDDLFRVTGSVTQDGTGVSGTFPIEWGTVKGDLITFKVDLPFQSGSMHEVFVHLGQIHGDQIDFGRRPEDLSRGRLREFTATRAK